MVERERHGRRFDLSPWLEDACASSSLPLGSQVSVIWRSKNVGDCPMVSVRIRAVQCWLALAAAQRFAMQSTSGTAALQRGLCFHALADADEVRALRPARRRIGSS